MEIFSKFLSRKIVMSLIFGVGVPLCFHTLGISENVILASITLGGLYLGANAVVAKKTE